MKLLPTCLLLLLKMTNSPTDFRALCVELVEAWDDLPWEYDFKGNLTGLRGDLFDESVVDHARLVLAQPEPQGPTDEEILSAAATAIEPYKNSGIAVGEYETETCAIEVYGSELIAFARAVLSRWGCQ